MHACCWWQPTPTAAQSAARHPAATVHARLHQQDQHLQQRHHCCLQTAQSQCRQRQDRQRPHLRQGLSCRRCVQSQGGPEGAACPWHCADPVPSRHHCGWVACRRHQRPSQTLFRRFRSGLRGAIAWPAQFHRGRGRQGESRPSLFVQATTCRRCVVSGSSRCRQGETWWSPTSVHATRLCLASEHWLHVVNVDELPQLVNASNASGGARCRRRLWCPW